MTSNERVIAVGAVTKVPDAGLSHHRLPSEIVQTIVEQPRGLALVDQLESAMARFEVGGSNPPLLDEIDTCIVELQACLSSLPSARVALQVIEKSARSMTRFASSGLSLGIAATSKRNALEGCRTLKLVLHLESITTARQ